MFIFSQKLNITLPLFRLKSVVFRLARAPALSRSPEQFRSKIALRAFVDGTVLALIRHNEVKPEDFAMKGERCVCADQQVFSRLLHAFEEMFAARHAFYHSLAEIDAVCECPLNDAVDNLAESFAGLLEQKTEIFLPRLTPCPVT